MDVSIVSSFFSIVFVLRRRPLVNGAWWRIGHFNWLKIPVLLIKLKLSRRQPYRCSMWVKGAVWGNFTFHVLWAYTIHTLQKCVSYLPFYRSFFPRTWKFLNQLPAAVFPQSFNMGSLSGGYTNSLRAGTACNSPDSTKYVLGRRWLLSFR